MLSLERGRSNYQPVHSLRMNKKVSFAERLAQMQTAVASMRAILEIVEREASAMAEVQQRFTARKPAQKRQANSSRVAAVSKPDPLTGVGFCFVGRWFWQPAPVILANIASDV